MNTLRYVRSLQGHLLEASLNGLPPTRLLHPSSELRSRYLISMTTTSKVDDVGQNSIYDASGTFRRSFAATCGELCVEDNSVRAVFSAAPIAGASQVRLSAALQIMLMYVVVKNLVLDLILVLQTHDTTRSLPSRKGSANLLEDLFSLGSTVFSDNFDINSTIPLLELVVNNASDE